MKLQVKDENDNWINTKPILNLNKRLTYVLINNINCMPFVTNAYLAEFYFYNIKEINSNITRTVPCLIITREEWELQGCE